MSLLCCYTHLHSNVKLPKSKPSDSQINSKMETQLKHLLCPAGAAKPPRRAVLRNGCIGAKRSPEEQEVELLSKICELVRTSLRLPVYPRDTTALLQLCLQSNDPGAWDALHADLKLNDADTEAIARVVTASPHAASTLVMALLHVKTAAHLSDVAGCLTAILKTIPDHTKAEFAKSLGYNLPAFVDAFWKLGVTIRRDVRDASISAIGRLLAVDCMVPIENLADQLLMVLHHKRDELVQLFVHAPMEHALIIRPQLITALLDRARVVPVAARYPLLSMLARLLNTPTGERVKAQCGIFIKELARTTLHGALAGPVTLDPRTALVCSLLVQASPDAASTKTLDGALAKALQVMASTVCMSVV